MPHLPRFERERHDAFCEWLVGFARSANQLQRESGSDRGFQLGALPP
jgi:hypothetical protein